MAISVIGYEEVMFQKEKNIYTYIYKDRERESEKATRTHTFLLTTSWVHGEQASHSLCRNNDTESPLVVRGMRTEPSQRTVTAEWMMQSMTVT